MERQSRIRQGEQEQNLKFDFESPLECVQADGLYTVAVADAKGRKRQAILLAFLDDATRRVVFAGVRLLGELACIRTGHQAYPVRSRAYWSALCR